MSLLQQILFFTFTIFPFLLSSYAKTVTRYIDDTYGDLVTGFKPSYSPTGSKIWQDQSCGTVQGCHIVPDTKLSHNGTYTAATYQMSMNNMGFNLIFRGTSITVYFILANDDYTLPTTTRTECNFILNGILEKSYVHTPVKNKGTEYNVTVFKKEGLEDRVHTLDIGTGKKDYPVFIAFDYATYTVEEPDEDTDNRNGTTTASGSTESDSKSSSPTGAIVGGVIGALVLIGCALVAFFLCRRRRNAKPKPVDIDGPGNNIQVAPYMAQAQPQHGNDYNPYNAPGPRSSGVPTYYQTQTYTAHSRATSASYPSDSYRDTSGSATTFEPESSSTGTGRFGSSAPTPAPIPIRSPLSEKGLLMQRQQQLDRMREELTTLESSRGYAHAPRSDSGTIRSGVTSTEGEMAELREQIRELQAQMRMYPGRQQEGQEVVDTPPPTYTR
ncbi:hypothetical protein PQX77_011369 [Marasmius sp. AFHP31]|nr:hypothetical protein PQX77_011369 [Marasmius sp. AFHP31]